MGKEDNNWDQSEVVLASKYTHISPHLDQRC